MDKMEKRISADGQRGSKSGVWSGESHQVMLLSIEVIPFHALELRRYRPACYAAPRTATLVIEAIVFVAIIDNP